MNKAQYTKNAIERLLTHLEKSDLPFVFMYIDENKEGNYNATHKGVKELSWLLHHAIKSHPIFAEIFTEAASLMAIEKAAEGLKDKSKLDQ